MPYRRSGPGDSSIENDARDVLSSRNSRAASRASSSQPDSLGSRPLMSLKRSIFRTPPSSPSETWPRYSRDARFSSSPPAPITTGVADAGGMACDQACTWPRSGVKWTRSGVSTGNHWKRKSVVSEARGRIANARSRVAVARREVDAVAMVDRQTLEEEERLVRVTLPNREVQVSLGDGLTQFKEPTETRTALPVGA